MILIGDIGNTVTKICLINQKKKIIKRISINTKQITNHYIQKKLISFLPKIGVNKKSIFCSVVPKAFNFIKHALNKKFKIKCIELKKINFSKIMKIRVNKKQIGSDRLSNALAVISNKNKNFIILDFGTATTFDVVVNRFYNGGVIAPGVQLSLNTLISKASLIPPINLKKIKYVIGKNTSSAVRSGFFYGYSGLIDNIVELIKKETKKSFKIIITGGLAHLFKKSIKSKVIIDKDITIKGLIRLTQLLNI